jgi:ParB family transcriptional regulator, chromosome partitioning protein
MSKSNGKQKPAAAEPLLKTIEVPLNQLTAWEGNVRKTTPDAGLKELAASIDALGLLNPLTIKQAETGFIVIAGRRRLTALYVLAKDGKVPADFPVPCTVVSPDANATEISLAENVVRERMHPADQFEAFKALADEGKAVADIAARFGVTETMVRQRMKLADVSPKIVKAFRKDELNLEQVMAYAVTNDHKRQERFFKDSGNSAHPSYIRRSLTEGEISAADKRVRFVTLEAYEAAGGATRRDLFTDGDHGVFILNALLLDTLVAEKLQNEVEKVKAEGWKWVEAYPELSWQQQSDMKLKRHSPEYAALSPEAEKEIETLRAEEAKLYEGEDELTEEESQRLDEITDRIEELEETPEIWPTEIQSTSGVLITIGQNGQAEIARGYIKPEDQKKEKGKKEAEPATAKKAEKPEYSLALMQELNTYKSAALGATLATKPDVALAAVVHCLAFSRFYGIGYGKSNLDLSFQAMRPAKDVDAKNCRGLAELEKMHKEWKKKLPPKSVDLWHWCTEQDTATLLSLLAYIAGVTAHTRATDKNALAQAAGLDMADWFTPTDDNYFSRVSKDQVLSALSEATGEKQPTSVTGMKRGPLAKHAEKTIQKLGVKWIPAIFKNV